MSPIAPRSPQSTEPSRSPYAPGPRRRPPTLRQRVITFVGLAVSFLLLVGLVVWLQGSGEAAIAAPAVRVLGASVSTSTAAPGEVVTVSAGLRNEGAPMPDLTVELEIRGQDNQIALRAPRRGIRLEASHDQNLAWVWRIPNDLPPGHYHADVSVYGTNWIPLYARLEDGADFVVNRK